jgi:hypothetical protein
VLENCLTPPTLSERRFFANDAGHRAKSLMV